MAGNVNPFGFLANDHRAVEELFQRLSSGKHVNREETIDRLIFELSVHAELEEEFVYPAIRRNVDGGRRLANHASDEHAHVKEMLDELDAMDPGGRDAEALIGELHQVMRDHVAEEEGPNGMFAQLREAMDQNSLNQLGSELTQAKIDRTVENPAPEDGVAPPPRDVGGRTFHMQK